MALQRIGVRVGLLSGELGNPHSVLDKYEVSVYSPAKTFLRRATYSRYVANAIRNFKADLLHDNGIWLPENHAVSQQARSLNRKLIVAPRGMLEPWPLQHRAVKKKVAWALYQRRDILRAHRIVATAETERQNILALLPELDVAVVPNGWEAPFPAKGTEISGPAGRTRKVLFFSRIHPIKGIELLLEAWGNLRPRKWRLEIVGPGDSSYIAQLKLRTIELGISGDVKFLPPVYGSDAKTRVLAAADLFILPSYSENFGSAVVEAMGSSVPVITTTGTPWSELQESNAGWWVEPSIEGIGFALQEAVRLSDDERRAIGRRGHDIVMSKYTWRAVANQMLKVYEESLRA
ncbi:MAG: glycosyltransferase [Woeseiaceae bacterium]|nr:glycosyltransferase [Woeseiaceae bacterium]